MSSLLFVDVETTGLDGVKNGIIQLAAIPVIDGEIKESFSSYLRPPDSIRIDEGALKVNQITMLQILSFRPESEVLDEFISYVNNLKSKFKLVGYNIQFDKNFLFNLFSRNNRYGDYKDLFRDGSVDVMDMAKKYAGKTKNYKLGTVCDHYGIKIKNSHDALSDITATLELFNIIKSLKPQSMYEKELTYKQKREKFLANKYIQIGKDNDVFITKDATLDKEALMFIVQELWDLYGDD